MNMGLVKTALLFAALGACATPPSPPPPDHRAALVKPCARAGDWSPWLLVDGWQDGEVYRPETQFQENGVMIYAYDGQKFDNGKWTLEGGVLHFDTNDHYADYDGKFDGERGSGTMKNVAGNTGKWTLERACDD